VDSIFVPVRVYAKAGREAAPAGVARDCLIA